MAIDAEADESEIDIEDAVQWVTTQRRQYALFATR